MDSFISLGKEDNLCVALRTLPKSEIAQDIRTLDEKPKGLHFWKKSWIDFLQYLSDFSLFFNSVNIIVEEAKSGS